MYYTFAGLLEFFEQNKYMFDVNLNMNKYMFDVNLNMNKYMFDVNCNPQPALQVYGDSINHVSDFGYLGSMVASG